MNYVHGTAYSFPGTNTLGEAQNTSNTPLIMTGETRDVMPVEDLSNMLHETRAMAKDAERLAGKIGEHLFGNKKEAACSGEAKCAEPANFKEELADTRRTLKETLDALAKFCTLVGV